MRNEFLVYVLVGTESKYLLTTGNIPGQALLYLTPYVIHERITAVITQTIGRRGSRDYSISKMLTVRIKKA